MTDKKLHVAVIFGGRSGEHEVSLASAAAVGAGLEVAVDRATGRPVWPIEERPVPQSDVPGERTSATQPFPTKPPPFDRQGVSEDDLIDFTPELKAEALKMVSEWKLGPLYTPPIVAGTGGKRGTLMLPNMTGGANWQGGAADPDPADDVYALGLLLLEALTGERAFACENTVDTLHAIVHDAPPDLLRHRADVSASMETIVSRLLQKAPEDRFQTAAEVVWALEQPVAQAGQARAQIEAPKARPTLRVHARTWIPVLAAVVLAAVAAGAFLWHRWNRPAINSVAVLPFEHYSTAPEDILLAARLTDAVTTELARLGSVSVASRTSAARVGSGSDPDTRQPGRVPAIAEALGVRFVMESSVVVEGGVVHVAARLVDAVRDRKVWVGEYDFAPAEVGPGSRRIAVESADGALKYLAKQR